MKSIWQDTVAIPEFEPQRENIKTDVLIVGGGITGILCAYLLTAAGAENTLIEAKRLCSGATGNTTAKLTSQHGLIFHKLTRSLGAEKARLYLQANQEALEKYRTLCQKIDCDFEEKDAIVYSTSGRKKLDDELASLQRLGFSAELVNDLLLPFPTDGGLRFPNQAQFHPLKFLSAITPGLPILENTKLQSLSSKTVVTDRGTIQADKIIIATHFPILNKHGSYFIKQYQQRSYVLALENAPDVGGMYIGDSEGSLSFRNQKGLLLLGGGGHRTGKNGGGWQELRQYASKYYPNATEVSHWAAQDCISLDGVPYIGQYSKNTPDLYVATGYNKWGMTTAMTAATVLTDLVLGKENPYTALFSPSRSILHPQLATNCFEATVNLLSPGVHRCPHLGCALKWNAQEHSWDCPCHGSRFSADGQLLDNPACDDIRHR